MTTSAEPSSGILLRVGNRTKRVSALARRIVDANTRVLPSFLIVGTQRGGTTALHSYLCAHPFVRRPTRKEIHYFDRLYFLGNRWYKAHFPGNEEDRDWITGEATADYLYESAVPERVFRVLQAPKIIVLLRDPVDRAYSAWSLMHRRGRDPRSFSEAVGDELLFTNDRPRTRPFIRGPLAYLARGLYRDQLVRWGEFFDLSKMLILRSEDLLRDPITVYGQTLEYLDLPSYDNVEFARKHATDSSPMDPELRRVLRAYYREHNQNLEVLLGRRLEW